MKAKYKRPLSLIRGRPVEPSQRDLWPLATFKRINSRGIWDLHMLYIYSNGCCGIGLNTLQMWKSESLPATWQQQYWVHKTQQPCVLRERTCTHRTEVESNGTIQKKRHFVMSSLEWPLNCRTTTSVGTDERVSWNWVAILGVSRFYQRLFEAIRPTVPDRFAAAKFAWNPPLVLPQDLCCIEKPMTPAIQ